jgi:DNA-binding MarR family transcriptional regulator
MLAAAVAAMLDCYPKIFFACHRRHVRDDSSGQILSARQASVLDHLDTAAPIHLHQLAGHLGVTPSTMSLMIDRLEHGGFVRRSRDAGDARRVNLCLTQSGARIKERQKVLDQRLVESLLRRLSPADRGAAVAGLQILARAADEMLATGESQRRQKEMTA